MIINVLMSSWGIVTETLQCCGCIHGNGGKMFNHDEVAQDQNIP